MATAAATRRLTTLLLRHAAIRHLITRVLQPRTAMAALPVVATMVAAEAVASTAAEAALTLAVVADLMVAVAADLMAVTANS